MKKDNRREGCEKQQRERKETQKRANASLSTTSSAKKPSTDAGERNSDQNKDKMIRTIVKKLLKYNSTSITDLPELLDMLDKGYDVNIADMGDDYVKHKLYKLFKLFGLVHDQRNKFSFKRTQPTRLVDPFTMQTHSMKEYVLILINDYKKELAKTSKRENEYDQSMSGSQSKRVCVGPEESKEGKKEEEEAWLQLLEGGEAPDALQTTTREETGPRIESSRERENNPRSLFDDHKKRMRWAKKREEKQKKQANSMALSQGNLDSFPSSFI